MKCNFSVEGFCQISQTSREWVQCDGDSDNDMKGCPIWNITNQLKHIRQNVLNV